MRLGLKKGKVTEEMKDKIYHMTIEGHSSANIAKQLGLCLQSIVFHRKKMRIEGDNGLGFIY